MILYWALLVLADALKWILRAVRAGFLELGNWNQSRFCLPGCAAPISDLNIGARDGEKSYLDQIFSNLAATRRPPDRAVGLLSRVSVVHEIGRIEPIHIVSVGSCEPQHFISEEILDIPGFKVSTVLDYRKLDTLINRAPALVLAHRSLLPIELEHTCRLVRRNCPFTRILVIHDGEEFLEDSLYDDRVRPDVSGKDLIARILLLVQTLDLWRLQDGRR